MLKKILVALLAVAAMACASRAPFMDDASRTVEPTPIAVPQDKAVLVVFQWGQGGHNWIVDEEGNLLGQTFRKTQAVLTLPPGPFRLYATTAGNVYALGDRLEGNLFAGKAYYATIGTRTGGITFRSLTPKAEDRWRHLALYQSTPRKALDPARLEAAQEKLTPIVEEMKSEVERNAAKYNARHLADRSISPEDFVEPEHLF